MTRPRLRIPLRVRLTLAFAAGMAVVLAGVGAFVYVNLRDDLRASVDSGLQSRAQVIAANAVQADPSLGGGRRRRLIDPDEAFAQVLAPSGRIIETTPRCRPRAAHVGRRPGGAQQAHVRRPTAARTRVVSPAGRARPARRATSPTSSLARR